MKTTKRARRVGPRSFDDIRELQSRLPRYWWDEVSRVRALIAKDADTALFEAENLNAVAHTFHTSEHEIARQHASALWQASRQLAAIASAQASLATA